jgi:hypothetical protein
MDEIYGSVKTKNMQNSGKKLKTREQTDGMIELRGVGCNSLKII